MVCVINLTEFNDAITVLHGSNRNSIINDSLRLFYIYSY